MVPTATVTLVSCACVILCRTVYAIKFMPSACTYGMASRAAVCDGAARAWWSDPAGILPLKPPEQILHSLAPVRALAERVVRGCCWPWAGLGDVVVIPTEDSAPSSLELGDVVRAV